MKAQNKLFLDTNRHFLKEIANGGIRGLQSQAAERVMREEFHPDYPLFSHNVFEHLADLMNNLYKYYDQWLLDNPNWQPAATRYGMQEESISKLEAYHKLANDVVSTSGAVRGFDIDGLLRVMLTEFDPAYQLNWDDLDQPVKFVGDIYRMFDERKAASTGKAGKKKG